MSMSQTITVLSLNTFFYSKKSEKVDTRREMIVFHIDG